ncbi:MAG TPA: hypothetical protein VHP83_07690, partial [Aggregatilineaceae bacterium]|nr:hypothetical protein [Aggregatilineaceae bacterium]
DLMLRYRTNGYEIYDKIKVHPALQHIPVIAVRASDPGIETPKLTTVAQYPSDFGQKLAEVLFERIDGLSPDYGRRIEVPLTLMPRESA